MISAPGRTPLRWHNQLTQYSRVRSSFWRGCSNRSLRISRWNVLAIKMPSFTAQTMDDYVLVLNAGSSSLKFSVFHRPGRESWRLEARGQIEGIGTAPRFSVKDSAGRQLADEKLVTSVRDGRTAIDALAIWL